MILLEFPKVEKINENIRVTIRPLRKEDEKKLHHYFLKLPPEDRLCLRDDVTNPTVIKNWIMDLDYEANLPLVAIVDEDIVANATLQFNPLGWTRHQGEIRITCDPEYRRKGLASVLIDHLITVATEYGLEQLTAEIAPTLDEAFFLFEKLGFKEAAILKNFIKDLKGNYEDLVILVKDIGN